MSPAATTNYYEPNRVKSLQRCTTDNSIMKPGGRQYAAILVEERSWNVSFQRLRTCCFTPPKSKVATNRVGLVERTREGKRRKPTDRTVPVSESSFYSLTDRTTSDEDQQLRPTSNPQVRRAAPQLPLSVVTPPSHLTQALPPRPPSALQSSRPTSISRRQQTVNPLRTPRNENAKPCAPITPGTPPTAPCSPMRHSFTASYDNGVSSSIPPMFRHSIPATPSYDSAMTPPCSPKPPNRPPHVSPAARRARLNSGVISASENTINSRHRRTMEHFAFESDELLRNIQPKAASKTVTPSPNPLADRPPRFPGAPAASSGMSSMMPITSINITPALLQRDCSDLQDSVFGGAGDASTYSESSEDTLQWNYDDGEDTGYSPRSVSSPPEWMSAWVSQGSSTQTPNKMPRSDSPSAFQLDPSAPIQGIDPRRSRASQELQFPWGSGYLPFSTLNEASPAGDASEICLGWMAAFPRTTLARRLHALQGLSHLERSDIARVTVVNGILKVHQTSAEERDDCAEEVQWEIPLRSCRISISQLDPERGHAVTLRIAASSRADEEAGQRENAPNSAQGLILLPVRLPRDMFTKTDNSREVTLVSEPEFTNLANRAMSPRSSKKSHQRTQPFPAAEEGERSSFIIPSFLGGMDHVQRFVPNEQNEAALNLLFCLDIQIRQAQEVEIQRLLQTYHSFFPRRRRYMFFDSL